MCAILSKIVQIPNFMKILIYIITFLFATSCHSQEKNTLQATQDDALTIGTTGGMNGGCKFLEQPVYYVNENYIIYQDCNTRKILYADISSFEIVKYYGQYGIALDKNGVYVQGNFVATDTTGFTFLGINEKDLLWKTLQDAQPIVVSEATVDEL